MVAATYGAADFFGGIAARRTPTTSVVVPVQVLGLVAVGALLVVAPGVATGRDLAFGAGAGVFGGIGVFLLFRGLATGRMSVVAPITAVGAAVLPVAWGLLTGERLSAVVGTGVVLALAAVVLIAREEDQPGEAPDGRGSKSTALAAAVGSGVAFGSLFVLLAQTDEAAGMWPLVGTRLAAIAVVGGGALVAGAALRPSREAVPVVAACGVLDIAANVLYLLAVRRGLLSLVAVLSALYPVATVLLARVVLGERLLRVQVGGLGMALGGVVLIATGG